MIAALIHLVIYIIIVGIIVWLLLWLIDAINGAQAKNGIVLNVVGTASYFAAFGAAGAGAAAGFASVPHSALRKSSHSPCVPLSVPALLAALYFSTHSRMVSSRAGAVTANATKLAPAIAKSSFFKVILGLFTVAGSMSDGLAGFHRMSVPSGEARNPALLR